MKSTILVGLLGVAGGLLGCGHDASSSSPLGAPGSRLTVDSNGAEYTSVTPAVLKATFDKTTTIELQLGGTGTNGSWAMVARVAPEDAAAGHVSASIVKGVMSADRSATVQATSGTATAGTIDATVTAGRVAGSATADPAAVSATFAGDVVVDCWVPSGAIPGYVQQNGGTTGDDGSQALVADTALASPQCGALRAWTK